MTKRSAVFDGVVAANENMPAISVTKASLRCRRPGGLRFSLAWMPARPQQSMQGSLRAVPTSSATRVDVHPMTPFACW